VPWNALHLIFAIGLVAAICSGFAIGPYQSYVWWGTTSTFFAMLTYMMVHTANIALYVARKRKANAPSTSSKTLQEWLLHLVVPSAGLVINGYLLIRSFFIELWLQDWATGKSIVLFDSGCALVVAGVVWWNRETSTEPRNEPSIGSATTPSQSFSIETLQVP
jgi:hypothetical protein